MMNDVFEIHVEVFPIHLICICILDFVLKYRPQVWHKKKGCTTQGVLQYPLADKHYHLCFIIIISEKVTRLPNPNPPT